MFPIHITVESGFYKLAHSQRLQRGGPSGHVRDLRGFACQLCTFPGLSFPFTVPWLISNFSSVRSFACLVLLPIGVFVLLCAFSKHAGWPARCRHWFRLATFLTLLYSYLYSCLVCLFPLSLLIPSFIYCSSFCLLCSDINCWTWLCSFPFYSHR